MQLSQLYRRGVVRPLDDCAARQLANFDIETTIRVEWLAVINDEQFSRIWQAGIFQRINDACGTEISDYEETELVANQIGRALSSMRGLTATNHSVSVFVENLDALFSEALVMNNNVYFVF
ncbi:MAG: hypothetical protein ACKVT0_21155 [Planctomycetaceae bacterium]